MDMDVVKVMGRYGQVVSGRQGGRLFPKPLLFIFFRWRRRRLFDEPFEKEDQRFPALGGDNGYQLPSLFSVLRQTDPLKIQKRSLVQSPKIGLPDHILPFRHEKPQPPFRSAFAYHTDFYPQINRFFELAALPFESWFWGESLDGAR